MASIFLNNYLIPICGIEGGAWATLGSNVFYYILLLLYVKWRVGTYPFSRGQFKVLAGLLMLVLNYLLVFAVGKLVAESSLAFRVGEAVVRTGIVSVVGLLVVYYWRVSEDVNGLIRKGMRKVKGEN